MNARELQEQARRRASLRYRLGFWWSFGWLEGVFAAGRGELHDMEYVGAGRLAFGDVQLREERLRTRAVARGQAAWEAVRAMPNRVNAALTCQACDYVHVIREAPYAGQQVDHRGTLGIGRFHDPYVGRWQAAWFRLMRAELARGTGLNNALHCRKCDVEAQPDVRLY